LSLLADGRTYAMSALDAQTCYDLHRKNDESFAVTSNPPRFIYFEDMEKSIVSDMEHSGPSMKLSTFLNAVDGVAEIDNVVIIGTTNNIKTLKDSITKRPGRFDIIAHIDFPSNESIAGLFDYFKIGIIGGNDKYIKELEGLSMAFAELFIKGCLFDARMADGVSVEIADKVLKGIKEHCKSYDGNGGRVGF